MINFWKCMFYMTNIIRVMAKINIILGIRQIINYFDILRTCFRLKCCCYKWTVIYNVFIYIYMYMYIYIYICIIYIRIYIYIYIYNCMIGLTNILITTYIYIYIHINLCTARYLYVRRAAPPPECVGRAGTSYSHPWSYP